MGTINGNSVYLLWLIAYANCLVCGLDMFCTHFSSSEEVLQRERAIKSQSVCALEETEWQRAVMIISACSVAVLRTKWLRQSYKVFRPDHSVVVVCVFALNNTSIVFVLLYCFNNRANLSRSLSQSKT